MTEYLYISEWCVIKYTFNNNYLPFINNENIDTDKLVDNKILIYLKSNKKKSSISGFYGHCIIKELINKDSEIYEGLINKYNLCQIDNLLFISFDDIVKFDNIISLTDYNKLCTTLGLDKIKLPKIMELYNVYPYDIDTVIDNIDNEYTDETENEESEEEEDEEINETDDEMIEYNVPILWIPCNDIIERMDNSTIKKSLLLEHYKKCEKCDINDNNKFPLEFNKKINLLYIEEKTTLINNIINAYTHAKKYLDKLEIIDDINNDIINMIYYRCEDELYDKCIFVVNNKNDLGIK